MRKTTALLLSLLVLCSMSITVFAEDTTITTTVPDSHTLTVTADGANVFCNGQSGNQFTVERLSEPTLLIRAVSGKEIIQVCLNGEDITGQIKGASYTMESIYEDKELSVVTRDAAPAQGKTYTVQGTVKRDGQPVAGITIELRSTLKTNVTDSSGKFSFGNVECGKHSLTAIENGKVVGHVEFILTEGIAENLSLSDGIYTVTVNQSEIGINLTLNLTENDASVIDEVSGISTTSGNPNSPPTGDNSLMWLWGMLMLIAFAGLCVTLCCSRKIRK